MEPISTDKQATAPGAVAAEAPPLEEDVVRRIVPATHRISPRDARRVLPVVKVLAARDFKVKYKQSLLGPLWLVFQPLALLAGFLVAFRGLANVGGSATEYLVFALVGLSLWGFFQASMTIGSAGMISNGTLIRYTPCPRIAFPIAGTVACLPSFAVPAVAAFAVAASTGTLSPRVLLLPLGLGWLFLLTIGSVGIVCALAVRYRDVLSAMPFLLQVGIFLAPVGYPLKDVSPTVRTLLDFNPLTGLIETWRWMTVSGYSPSFEPIGIALVATPLIVWAGWFVFSRLEITMADEI